MHLNKGYPGKKTLFCHNSETLDYASTFLAFFNVMTHLLLHVVDELDVCGPIYNQ
jgi:hypothetical protein